MEKNKSKKTAGIVSGVCWFILVWVVIISFYFAKETIFNKDIYLTMDSIQLKSEELRGFMESQMQRLSVYGETFLAFTNEEDAGKKETLQTFFLQSMQNEELNMLDLYYVDKTGKYISSIEGMDRENYPHMEMTWMKETQDDMLSVNMSPVYKSDIHGKNVITIAKCVVGQTGYEGVIAMDLSLEGILEAAESISTEEGSYIMLLDSENQVVYHKKKEYRASDSSYEQFDTLADGIYEPVKTKIEKQSFDEITLEKSFKDYDGIERGYQITGLYNGWKMITMVEKDALQKDSQYILYIFIWATLLLLFAGIIMMRSFTNSMAVTEHVANRQIDTMKKEIRTDYLTGLYVRKYFRKLVDSFIAKEPGVYVLIDLDNFKSVNDTYGHLEGDNALKIVSEVMKRNVGDAGICGRFGGDEFAIFYKGKLSKKEVVKKIESIRSDFQEEKKKHKILKRTSLSFGIAFAKEKEENMDAIFEQADRALYYVKQNNKDGYHFFVSNK